MILTVDNAMEFLLDVVRKDGEERLCLPVLNDPSFCAAPGSTGHHHAFYGGLALHTAEVVWNCRAMAGPAIDWNVLLPAAVWHDYMKVCEYSLEPRGDGWAIGALPYRNLIGHVAGSVIELHRAVASGRIQVETLRLEKISHCMLAHHGRLEWRSPVEPISAEAWVLHSADMMSARGAGVLA